MNIDFFQDKKALKLFCDKNAISFLGMFGSHARGTATEDSDVDLLVEFNTPIDFFELLDTEEKLHRKTQKKIDLVTVKSVNSSILPYIQNDLVTLYERP